MTERLYRVTVEVYTLAPSGAAARETVMPILEGAMMAAGGDIAAVRFIDARHGHREVLAALAAAEDDWGGAVWRAARGGEDE